MSGSVDPIFKQIPKGSTCFLIWRIEKLQIVPLPRDQYASFYNGDSYIIYSASEPNQPGGMNVKEKPARALEQNIHFWLGSATSTDEAGVAAYKTVELDDFLGGAPIQHRETEGAESQRFRSYFPNGIRILQGGVESGFQHVSHVFIPKLFCVKGKRRPVVRQLPKVSWSNMNSGDAFLLQTKEAIFLWEGKTANNLEKLQAAKVSQQLKAESGAKSVIVFVKDGEEEQLQDIEKSLFEMYLPLKDRSQKKSASDYSDDAVDREVTHEIKLYRCSDDDGTLRVTEVKVGPLFQQDLNSGDSFIIDNGTRGIWVWIGKKASPKERIEAMRNAQGFIKKKGYPDHTQVTRVIDGGEPESFKSLFSAWKVKNETVGFGRQHSGGKGIAKISQSSFDATTLHEQPALAAKMKMIDDASGSKEVYKVHEFKLVEVPQQYQGSFFEHDCYVIKYSSSGPGEYILVYFWLGLKAKNEDRGAAALLAKELDDEVGGRAVQIRIVQGKEPAHFIALFRGEFTVYLGDADDSGYEPVKPYLLQVRGNVPEEARAFQVQRRAASLNSNDVFVLVGDSASFLWCGKGSTGDEREIAKKIAARDRVDCITVYEGQEREDFWSEIGGKEDYASDKRLASESTQKDPRLFQCSNATGILRAEEIVNYSQGDLVEDDVMLLDIGDTIFLWFGKDSNKEEQQGAVLMSTKYLASDPSGRDPDTPILVIKQGMEPPTFTGFFGVWDRSLWSNNQTFEELKAQMIGEQPILSASAITLIQTNGVDFESAKKHPIDVLSEKDQDKLPADVNPSMKEVHLNEADFQSIFKMDYQAFSELPLWKKTQLKKNAGLF
ncbi:advillin isoform X2 [Folsomia candida]|nr:advillin isoform X2 [Folsomia candida]